jgi:integrase
MRDQIVVSRTWAVAISAVPANSRPVVGKPRTGMEGGDVSPARPSAPRATRLAWLATREADIVRGTWVAPPTGKVTFGDYSQLRLQRQGHLRPRTRQLYEFLLRKHIDPTFGPRSLTAIANSEVVAWYRSLGAKVTGTAPKCFRLLRQIKSAAVADGYLVKSPVVIKGASREHVEEQAIPTLEEVDALAEAVDPRYRAMIWLAGACGLRLGGAGRSAA